MAGEVEVEGVQVILKICDAGGALVAILGQDDAKLKIKTDMIEKTIKATADKAKEYMVGRYSWTVDFSGLLQAGGSGAAGGIVATQLEGAKQDVAMYLGDDALTGQGFLSDFSGGGKDNDKGVFSGSLQGTGKLTPPSY